jgi:hypothetical protein
MRGVFPWRFPPDRSFWNSNLLPVYQPDRRRTLRASLGLGADRFKAGWRPISTRVANRLRLV